MDPIDLVDIPNPKLVDQNREAKPLHWFMPVLMVTGTKSTNLAFRSDNLYLSAFTNGAGEWFSFQPDNRGDYVVPGSTVLGFRSNYRSLLGDEKNIRRQGWEYLVDLDVGPDAIEHAAEVVSDFNPLTTPVPTIKRAIATLIVAFMEAQRFPCIRDFINGLWVDQRESKLRAREAQLVVNWKDISCALRMWDMSADKTKWDSKEANILKQEPPVGISMTTPKQALDAIWPIVIGKCKN